MATENGAVEPGIQSSSTGAELGQETGEEVGCLNPGLGWFLSGSFLPQPPCMAHGGLRSQNSLWVGLGWIKSPREFLPRETRKM